MNTGNPAYEKIKKMRIGSKILECIHQINKNKVFKWSFKNEEGFDRSEIQSVFNEVVDTQKYKIQFKEKHIAIEKI